MSGFENVFGAAVSVVALFVTAWWAGRVSDRRKKEGRR